jgi:hypothetical protein
MGLITTEGGMPTKEMPAAELPDALQSGMSFAFAKALKSAMATSIIAQRRRCLQGQKELPVCLLRIVCASIVCTFR